MFNVPKQRMTCLSQIDWFATQNKHSRVPPTVCLIQRHHNERTTEEDGELQLKSIYLNQISPSLCSYKSNRKTGKQNLPSIIKRELTRLGSSASPLACSFPDPQTVDYNIIQRCPRGNCWHIFISTHSMAPRHFKTLISFFSQWSGLVLPSNQAWVYTRLGVCRRH
jgi:hypothetical protein